jgi:hypothetical protein
VAKAQELRLATSQQRAAYEEMLPAAKAAFKKIYTKASNLATADLLTRWEIGDVVLEGTKNERLYGQEVVKQWARALGDDVNEVQLYQYRRFAGAFSREDLLALLERRTVKGGQISWTHVRALLPLERGQGAAKCRKEIIERIFQDGLSCTQVSEAVKEHLGGPMSKGGRTPAAPKTPKQAMTQIEKFSSAIINRAELWDRALWKAVGDGPAEQCTPDLLEQLEKTRASQVELQARIEELVLRADSAIARVKRVLAKGATADGEEVGEEEASEVIETPAAKAPRAVKKVTAGAKIRPDIRDDEEPVAGVRQKPALPAAQATANSKGRPVGATTTASISSLGREKPGLATVPSATAAMLDRVVRAVRGTKR